MNGKQVELDFSQRLGSDLTATTSDLEPGLIILVHEEVFFQVGLGLPGNGGENVSDLTEKLILTAPGLRSKAGRVETVWETEATVKVNVGPVWWGLTPPRLAGPLRKEGPPLCISSES